MHILFSVDNVNNINILYTYTLEKDGDLGETKVKHYLGDVYCKQIIIETLANLQSTDWLKHNYIGSRERIANECFELISKDGDIYNISFTINTYNDELARMEICIISPATDRYDQKLEDLKIALKNRLLKDWNKCTWLADDQAGVLCKEAYEKAYSVENNLRAFASRVLIHFFGVDWIKRFGLEKEAESVNNLKNKFIQRVPEFDNINTDFLSMTLETLVGIIFEGIIYNDNIVLTREQYMCIQKIGTVRDGKGNIADYVKKIRTIDKKIWDDIFVLYIDNPDRFKTVTHSFIEDRNHIAHSKVLSWRSYQVIISNFNEMNSIIHQANMKFETEESSDELIHTIEIEYEDIKYEKEYYRTRLEGETGMDILDEYEIKEQFDEVMHDIFNSVYQRYHLDVCFEISDFLFNEENKMFFSVKSPAVEDGSAKLDVCAEYCIDDELGEHSTCKIIAYNAIKEVICYTEIYYHNGNGCEGENGLMEATDNSEFDTSNLDDFYENLFEAIESLNPYISKLNALEYQDKCAEQYVADFACEQCGNFGISVNEELLKVGRCCYCGYESELVYCTRCGELIDEDLMENGFCPTCASYIDKQ